MELKHDEIPFNEGSGSSLMTAVSTLLLFLATMFYASYDALKVQKAHFSAVQCPGYIVALPETIGTDLHQYDNALKELFSSMSDVFSYELISDQDKTYFADLGVPDISGNYIDVKTLPNATLSKNRLVVELDQIIPGVQAIDRVSLIQQKQLERNVLSTSILCLVFVLIFSVMIAAAFIARSQYRLHSKIIDILHYLGASNRYISHKFQKHFFQKVVKGGLFGTISAFLVLILIGLTLIDPQLFKSWIVHQLMNMCLILTMAVVTVILTVRMIVFLLIRHSH